MNSTFGARLRQQREERQVTLTTISTKTKIKLALLEALEGDDLSFWPKGLFGRAYLRDYATAVGLDPEALVSEFLTLYPEFAYVTPEVEEAAAAARADAARTGPAQLLRRFVSSAFAVRSTRQPVPQPAGFADERLDFESMPQVEPEAETFDEAGPVLAGVSMAHALAEAQERTITPYAEYERQADLSNDFVVDAPSEPSFLPEPPAAPVAHESREISLLAIAEVCTRLARAIDLREVAIHLSDAARLLDAVGVIVWRWDPHATALRPSLTCGYSDAVIARFPGVRLNEANAVAAAFRSGEQCIVDGAAGAEAVAVPTLGVGGCVGVLAVELRPGTRKRESVCAFTNILAAQLATLLPVPEPVEA